MKIKEHLWEGFMVLAGVIVAVLVVSLWSGCSTPAKKKTASPMSAQSEKAMAATAAPSPTTDPAQKASMQVPPADASSDPNAPLHKLRGVVQSFDADAGTLVVKLADGSTQEFKVDAAAKITKGGDFTTIAISDVKAGDHVTLGCRGTAAESVHVKVVAAP